MKSSLSARIDTTPDAVVRFVNAGKRADFCDPGLKAAYAQAFAGDELILKHKEIFSFRMSLSGKYTTAMFVGLDASLKAGSCRAYDDLRHVILSVGERLEELGCRDIVFDRLDELTLANEDEILRQISSTLALCEYSFDKYLSKKSTRVQMNVRILTGCAEAADTDGKVQSRMAQLGDALAEGDILAQSMCHARDLINEPAYVLTPAELADRAKTLGDTYGFETEIFDREECEKLGMGLFLAVSSASMYEPKLIVMRYNGSAEGEAPIALVGKGITYDSGGLHIKTSAMESMRYDMNGAAAMIGAMCAIAGRRLSKNVVAVVAACENAVGSHAYRNGDTIRSMSGKTVFVRNTDAEGRLSMADAITYVIRRFSPSEIIEGAGLTGSVCNFYDNVCAATLATDESMHERISALTPITGEKFAAMPYFPEYREKLRSPYADLDNMPAGAAGGILAGCFLAEFAEDTPFLHIDFGAMPFTSRKSAGQPEGGTGFGVKSIYYYVKNREEKA